MNSERYHSFWAIRFFRWYCHPDFAEDLEGDLYERYSRNSEKSEQIARLTLIKDVIKLFRPALMRPLFNSKFQNNTSMFKNYFKSAFRSFAKNLSFTLLNVLGLSVGLATTLLILQYVKYEKSYDTFHSQIDNIYRIQYNIIQDNQLIVECAAAVPAVGPALADNFEEVEKFTRLFPRSGIISYNDPEKGLISFREEKMQITDPRVFEVFDFKLLKGNPKTSLEGLNKTVISERAAQKYFGNSDPIGKRILYNGETEYEVTGIFENVPDNSHIKFDFLFSFETLNQQSNNESETNWGWYDFNTYVLMKPGTDIEEFQGKWDNYLAEVRGEDWEHRNYKSEFILRPAKEIHLHSNLLQESEPAEQGDAEAVYFLTVIAIFILIIALINYINLSTAKSIERAKEVGVRKVMGGEKSQLIKQFLVESFLINVLAMAIALMIIAISWNAFLNLTGRDIPLDYLLSADFAGLVISLILLSSILSGAYPAWVLSSFKPVSVLKGKLLGSASGNILRKGLVIFQFSASIILIIGTLVVYNQLAFMKSQDLGIDIKSTLVLEGPAVTNDSLYGQYLETFKTKANQISGVEAVSAASNVPGDEIFWTRGIRKLVNGAVNSLTVYNMGIDHDYVPTFDLKVIAGRNFSKDFPNDNERVLLNRELAAMLDFESPEAAIGEKVILGRDTMEVAGVLENYHQMSLKNKVKPLVFRLFESRSFISLKLNEKNTDNIIAELRGPWNQIFPNNPIDYFFLDSFFNKQYESDQQFGQVFTLFSMLAIIIACLGLFGLSSYLTLKRSKEIGIRKVLGSSVNNIVYLLSKGFLSLVLVANIIAWPLAWFIMNGWLNSFPYRIDMNPLFFLAAALSVVFIALLSVGYQTVKAAITNPVQSLRNE
ncbi:MAG: ABC transporter permease [Fulvivirga sp.]|uniref:ABC transporter permease n=1 Tax=Fulvivirga sp. TaxID=1931237 RepID=UPI0032EB98EB